MRSGRPRACSRRPGAEQRRACPPSAASSVPPRSPESCLPAPAPGRCSLCSACPAGHCWHLGTHPGPGAVHPPYYLRGQASPLHTVTPDVKAGAQTGQGCCLELSPEPQAGQPQAGARPARHLGPGLRVQERSHTAGPVLPGPPCPPSQGFRLGDGQGPPFPTRQAWATRAASQRRRRWAGPNMLLGSQGEESRGLGRCPVFPLPAPPAEEAWAPRLSSVQTSQAPVTPALWAPQLMADPPQTHSTKSPGLARDRGAVCHPLAPSAASHSR